MTISIITNIIVYIRIVSTMQHHVFMYDERDKTTNSQTNSSTKYILNTYGGAQNEIYCN